MQKIAPHTVPLAQQQDAVPSSPSPALQLAQRIRREQGLEHARRYLEAMEPFVARGERERIAEHIGVPLAPLRAEPQTNSAPAQNNRSNHNAPGNSIGGGGPMGGMGGMGANPMQLMQMMSQMGGPGGGGMNGMNGMNPMMLAQMFGNMMGGR